MTFVIPANPTKEPRKYMVHHHRREQEATPFQPQGPNPWKVLLILVASFLCLVLLFFDHVYLIALEPPSSYHSRDNKPSSFVVDVLSVGSTDRWDFVTRQQKTWGAHSSVRYFHGVNEGHHEAYGNSTCIELQSQVDECMEQHAKIPADAQGRRYYMAPEMESLALVRNRPDGWWCAQRRHVIGLHRLFSQRYTYQQDYPDWLLIVDDDTFYNMSIFQHSCYHRWIPIKSTSWWEEKTISIGETEDLVLPYHELRCSDSTRRFIAVHNNNNLSLRRPKDLVQICNPT